MEQPRCKLCGRYMALETPYLAVCRHCGTSMYRLNREEASMYQPQHATASDIGMRAVDGFSGFIAGLGYTAKALVVAPVGTFLGCATFQGILGSNMIWENKWIYLLALCGVEYKLYRSRQHQKQMMETKKMNRY